MAFYVRHAATDGTRVVYESAGQLWLLDELDSEPRPLDIRLGGPRTAREPHRITTGDWLGSVVPDTTGRSSVVTVRGTVHRLTHRDGPARTLLARDGVRARLATPLGADQAVWVDDALGEDAVCVAPLDPRAPDAPAEQRFGSGEVGRVLQLEPAPDGESVALTTHDGRLLLLDPASGDFRELARGDDGEIYDVAFSPDGAWLTYRDPVGSGRSQVMLVRLEDGESVAVTEGRFRDADPVFTLDGKHLAFLSQRSFDPIYDEHSFDLTFPASWRPFLVPLGARTPSPFGASPDGRPVSPEDDKPEDPPALDPSDPADETDESPAEERTDSKDDGPPEVVVDVRGARGARGAGPRRRGALLRHARGEGMPAVVPVPDQWARSATVARAPR